MLSPAVTLQVAIAKVIARIGLLDDGVDDPELVAHVTDAINSAQDQLSVEHQYLRQRRQIVKTITGVRLFDLPVDARHGQVQTVVHVDDGGARRLLLPGIDREARIESGTPARFDISPSTGIIGVTIANGGTGYAAQVLGVTGGSRSADGSGPVVTATVDTGVITGGTISESGAGWITAPTLTATGGASASLTAILGPVQVMELDCVPTGGSLAIDYLAGVFELEDEADLLSLDKEAVIGRAAWLVAASPARRMPNADNLMAAHNAYLSSFRTQQRPGQVVSLRRRDVPVYIDPRLMGGAVRLPR
jgi:hypothetical protein